jgi:hypothetical protein
MDSVQGCFLDTDMCQLCCMHIHYCESELPDVNNSDQTH